MQDVIQQQIDMFPGSKMTVFVGSEEYAGVPLSVSGGILKIKLQDGMVAILVRSIDAVTVMELAQ